MSLLLTAQPESHYHGNKSSTVPKKNTPKTQKTAEYWRLHCISLNCFKPVQKSSWHRVNDNHLDAKMLATEGEDWGATGWRLEGALLVMLSADGGSIWEIRAAVWPLKTCVLLCRSDRVSKAHCHTSLLSLPGKGRGRGFSLHSLWDLSNWETDNCIHP